MSPGQEAEWPPGDGEMAARVRRHDWAQTPLGPVEGWSDRLKVMVEQVLASPLVSSLACGPRHLLIYNDAAARLYGDRHPIALGRPLPETFPEGWATVAPFYARAFAGESVSVTAQPLDTRGEGDPPTDMFDALLLPVREADGRVACVHMTGVEFGARARAEAALRAGEARQRDLFDAIDEGFCVIEVLFDAAERSVDYRFLAVNAAFARQTGLSDVVGRRMTVIAPAHERRWFAIFGRIARTGVSERFEDWAEVLGRWYDVFAFRIGTPDQRQVGVLFKDVSERKQAEIALRESESRFRAFVTASADVVYRMGPDWSEMRQLDGLDFLADTAEPNEGWMERYIHPDDQPSVRSAIARAIRDKSLFDLEYRVRRADGRLGWIHSRAAPILDESGEITEWLGAASDVTARRRAEEELRESEERFRGLVEGFGQFSWEASPDGLIVADSPGWRTHTGQDLAEWRGYGWLNAIHLDDRADTERKWRATVAAGCPVDAEYRLWHAASGSWRWSNVRVVPITDRDGTIIKWAGVNIDVSDRRLLQARLEVLVNELQHRARNVLGVVSAVAGRTLRQGGSVDAFEERLQALSRAQGLLSQQGSDRVEVGALVRAELAAHADRSDKRIQMAGPEVLLTARQVQNFALALHELTTNAVKYGALEDDGGRLDIGWTVKRDRRDRRRLELSWIESGVVVPPDAIERRGYGTELIREALAYALQAKVDYALGDDGVRCLIAMPIA